MEWLTELLTAIRNFFPKSFTVLPDEGGVRITLGTKVKLLKPGWYIYYPPIQYVEKIGVTPQPIDLRAQSVLTTDDKDLAISGAILYKIVDARKAILEVQNYDKNVVNIALGVIAEHIGSHASDKLEVEKLREAVLTKVREEAAGFGLKIMRFYITDLGHTRNLRVFGETRTYKNLEGEG